MKTPHASAVTGLCIKGASQTAQMINEMFNNTGVNAGTAKRP